MLINLQPIPFHPILHLPFPILQVGPKSPDLLVFGARAQSPPRAVPCGLQPRQMLQVCIITRGFGCTFISYNLPSHRLRFWHCPEVCVQPDSLGSLSLLLFSGLFPPSRFLAPLFPPSHRFVCLSSLRPGPQRPPRLHPVHGQQTHPVRCSDRPKTYVWFSVTGEPCYSQGSELQESKSGVLRLHDGFR